MATFNTVAEQLDECMNDQFLNSDFNLPINRGDRIEIQTVLASRPLAHYHFLVVLN